MHRIHERLDEGGWILTNSRRAINTAGRLQRGAVPTPDKAALLTKLLLEERPLCVACISAESGLLVDEIEPTVSRLEQTIFVNRDMGSCRTSDRWTLVYSLFGNPQPR